MGSPARAVWLAAVIACLPILAGAGDQALVPDLPPVAELTPADGVPLQVQVLDPALGNPAPGQMTGGGLDTQFGPFVARGSHRTTAPLGFRLPPLHAGPPAEDGVIPVLIARADTAQYAAKRSGRNQVPLAEAFAA